MVITLSVNIYGFGSFFNGSETFKDVDLLIVHDSGSYESCLKAIFLKREIKNQIDNADVTMLSVYEERQFKFIERASAIHLCYCEKDKEKESARKLKFQIQTIRMI